MSVFSVDVKKNQNELQKSVLGVILEGLIPATEHDGYKVTFFREFSITIERPRSSYLQ
jgi:hypothetical protein